MIIATLTATNSGVTDLGCGFKYEPYIPKKRIKTKPTAKGSFTQKSDPLFLHGSEFIPFSYDLIDSAFTKELTELYNADENFTFLGHYGENYTVEFSEWMPKPKKGAWTATGKFRIICVISGFSPTCGEETP